MIFRHYTNMFSQASRSFAVWTLIVGLLLAGFGVVILALPEVFAFLAAGVFFIMGAGCVVTAVRIFLAFRKFSRMDSDDSQGCRRNVRIHTEEHYDI